VQAVQLVDVVANAYPAAQKEQLEPVKAPLVWYFPCAQLLQPRLVVMEGVVVSYVPAPQVEYKSHTRLTEVEGVLDWYRPDAQVDHVAHDVPPLLLWYWPVGQLEQARFVVVEGFVV
jgi:hypothetical protein